MAHEDNIVDKMVTRQRQEKKNKLYVKIDGNSVVIGNKIRLSIKHGDNIIILEDEFKSSYDCSKCGGTGTNRFGSECSYCNGKGALIELPDQAKSRPTSGTVQCVGPDSKFYKQGDKVAYSGYTGHLIPFKGNTRLRIMKETEPFCLVEDLEGEQVGEEVQFVDKDTAYDLS